MVLEKILESPLDCKEVLLVHPKDISPEYSLERLMLKLKLQYLATWCEELTHWKRPWCREGLGTGEEGDDRGWGGWMASLTRWTWVWVNSGSWWWTGRPGVLRFMESQRVGHDWATELIGRFTGKLNDLNCFVELEVKQWSGSKKCKFYYWICNLLTVTKSSTSLGINFFSIRNERYRWPRWLPRSFYFLELEFHEQLLTEQLQNRKGTDQTPQW